MKQKLLAGSARVNITPPLFIPYLSFVPRQGFFSGIHDPLFARALVIDDDNRRIAILSADAIGFGNRILGPGRHFTDELRGRISEQCNIKPDHIMVACTHAHSTPETLGITNLRKVKGTASWLEVLIEQLSSAVQLACSNLTPSRLKLGKGLVAGLAHNRRPDFRNMSLGEQISAGRLDPELQILLCEHTGMNECTVVVNTQCHPVAVQVQPLVSADFPGVAARLVEQNLAGCRNCLFLQGAAGNLNPLHDNSRSFRHVNLYGTLVAGESLKAAARLALDENCNMKSSVLEVAVSRILLPPRELPDRETWERKHAEVKKKLRESHDRQEQTIAAREVRRVTETLDLIDHYADSQEAEVQVMRIGDLACLAVPGELFTEWGLKLKQESQAPFTFISELSNGWVGYLLNPGGFEEGGYETGLGPWTQTNERGARLIVDEALRLINGLWGKDG